MSGDYAGWVHYDGCVVCPGCNTFIPVDDDIPSILAGIASHVHVLAQAATATGSAPEHGKQD